ncbi:MAG: hypothetical protein QMD85_02965, partial [Candidatus Aenigmarchaeota archaeon]|nr:hypothetical protein [Candidatus Aenigmarchaeota archaeon]
QLLPIKAAALYFIYHKKIRYTPVSYTNEKGEYIYVGRDFSSDIAMQLKRLIDRKFAEYDSLYQELKEESIKDMESGM